MPVEAQPAAPERGPARQGACYAGRRRLLGGDIRLEALIGGGAATEVWRGHTRAGDAVAVKMLRPAWLERPGARELLRAEHRLLARLHYPHIVAARGLIDDRDEIGLVCELLSGGDMVSLAGSAPRHWAPAARDVLRTLGHLHAQGIVHRDVKARNLMFDACGQVRLIDFASAAPLGAARTSAGTTAAHRRARAPGAVTSVEDDLYAFTVLLYELMNGCLPTAETNATQSVAGDVPAVAALRDAVSAALRPQAGPEALSFSVFANVLNSVVAACRADASL